MRTDAVELTAAATQLRGLTGVYKTMQQAVVGLILSVVMSSPPYYVLLSHSNLSPSPSHATVSNMPTLAHPTIQYQFRDDPPLALPNSHHTHVIVMDYDPSSELVQAQSLSPQLAVTSLKVSDTPGAGSLAEDDGPRNIKMYVLETVAHPPEKGLVVV